MDGRSQQNGNNTTMKYSIVMAYFNRERQIHNTLKSFEAHGYKNLEVIIVDDASDQKLHIAPGLYSFPIKVIHISKDEKKYINPAYAYNLSTSFASGEILIVQNPECFHHGNILNFLETENTDNLVFSFPCYSVGIDFDTPEKLINIKAFAERAAGFDYDEGWYNHSTHRAVGYHFCMAMRKEYFSQLGGFDKAYYDGVGFDDDELVFRIKKNFKLLIPKQPIVIHQAHESFDLKSKAHLVRRNKFLYLLYTKRRIPKLIVLKVLLPLYEATKVNFK